MKKHAIIYNKFTFLNKHGFSYNHIHDKDLYHVCKFEKQNLSIAIEYDFHNEFLDFTIKSGVNILLQTSYANVITGKGYECNEGFITNLKTIYLLPKKSYSLSDKQFNMLLNLYAEYVLINLKELQDYNFTKHQ